ncbi:MAG: hypothetical protein HYZ75_15575 [Elusimicrobia bacterium]|nr:hypothetical protein [Elusimicrobiota bacterium]
MRRCFILGNKRGDYFHADRVRREAGPIRFIAIHDRAHAAFLSTEFRAQMDAVVELERLDVESVGRVIAAEAASDGDVLVCADEELLFVAAHLRERFAIPGVRPRSLIPYKTKRLMKQVLQANGLRAPRFVDVDTLHSRASLERYFDFLADTLGAPFVVKPIDGGASENTVKAASWRDLERWFRECSAAAGESTAEEFIDGDMFCCDGIVRGGKTVIHEVWRYLAPCLNFMSGQGIGGIPLRRDDALRARLVAFNERVLAALACPDGAFHNEFIVKKDGELVFIEAAARPPGNLNPLILEKNFGVNLYEALLRLELGVEIPAAGAASPSYAYALLPTRPGTVKALREPALASFESVSWGVKVGDRFEGFPRSIAEGIAAKVILRNPEYARLESDLFALLDYEPY